MQFDLLYELSNHSKFLQFFLLKFLHSHYKYVLTKIDLIEFPLS